MSKDNRLYMTVIAIPKDKKKHKKRVFKEVYDILHVFGPDGKDNKFLMALRLLSHLEKDVPPKRDTILLNDYEVIIKWEDIDQEDKDAGADEAGMAEGGDGGESSDKDRDDAGNV